MVIDGMRNPCQDLMYEHVMHGGLREPPTTAGTVISKPCAGQDRVCSSLGERHLGEIRRFGESIRSETWPWAIFARFVISAWKACRRASSRGPRGASRLHAAPDRFTSGAATRHSSAGERGRPVCSEACEAHQGVLWCQQATDRGCLGKTGMCPAIWEIAESAATRAAEPGAGRSCRYTRPYADWRTSAPG